MYRSVFNSSGLELQFPTKELYLAYKKATEAIDLEFYSKVRAQYGIWASNQNKFIPITEQLGDWDSKEMENRFKLYTQGEEK